MADIDIKQPAKINRNTAADGDFLWEKDFKVLYENDEKLKNAIQQASQDYTAGDGIDIDPSTKTISVKTGTGIEKTEEGLSVNIEGVDGAKVELQGNTFKVSAYNAKQEIDGLNDNLEELQQELKDYEDFAKEFYITSAAVSTPNTQYVYTTSGWQALAGGEVQELAYWRPYFDSADNKIKWEQQPSSILTPPSPSVSLKGPQGDKGDKGTDGINGVSPTVALSPIDDGTKTGTEIVITDKDGDHTYSAWNGINGKDGKDGTDGSNGKSVELSASTVNAHLNWRLVGDTTWQDLGYAVSGEVGPRGPQGEQGPQGIQGPKGDAPTIQAVKIDPTSEHLNGGVRWTIKYPEQSVSAVGEIWNGNNGTATVNCEGTYITGNGTAGNPIKLTSVAQQQIEAVSGKVNKPDTSLTDKYLALRTNLDGTVSGWTDILDKVYSRTAADNRYMQNHRDYTLSGNGTTNSPLGINTTNLDDNKKYAFTTNGWDEIDDFVKKTGDTMTGPLLVSASNHNIVGLGKGAFQFGQTRYNNDNVIGTNWMGVVNGAYTGGFLKYVDGGTSASEEGANGKVQINYSVDNGRGKIEVNASVPNGLQSSTQVINATTASVNGMAVSAIDSNNMSGPNYMIAKNADGQFVIGSAVYNCQGNLPGTLTPNTYYFVY